MDPGGGPLAAYRPLVFIPTYNERGNVRTIYERIKALDVQVDLLFIDDASPDGTGELLDDLALMDPHVTVLHRPSKQGVGSAHREGIAYAYAAGRSVLITMDGDLLHPVADITRLLAKSEEAEVVVGSRFLDPRSLSGWAPHRAALARLGHTLTRALLGIPYDATGAFRLYRLDRIDPHLFALAASNGYSFFFESLYMLWRRGVTMTEIPIIAPPRTYGASKMSMREPVRSAWTLISVFLRSLGGRDRARVVGIRPAGMTSTSELQRPSAAGVAEPES